MSDYQTIEAGYSGLRGMTLVAKASGNPIQGGTVTWFLLALSGANAAKWWKASDGTWNAAPPTNPMTHQADGHWTFNPMFGAVSPFTDGVTFLEYARESTDLHIPVARYLTAALTGTKLLQAEIYIETTTNPWQMVWIEAGTGDLATGTRLMVRKLYSTAGVPITSANVVIGQGKV